MSDKAKLFSDIVSNLCLLGHHKTALEKNRGFSAEAIEKLKFRSIGPHLKEEPWIKELEDEDLRFALTNKENILIPYLNKAGDVIHIRPHKFGLKGEPNHVYIPWPLIGSKEKPVIVVAESEFKAVASNLMGQAAIGIPGISSYSKSKMGELIEVLKSFNPGAIVFCFDNEKKDDPNNPNYKPDFTKRYDTQIYAYLMAKSMEKHFPEIEGKLMVATIPEEWMRNGKADIDQCLSLGMSPENWAMVIGLNSMSANNYRLSWKVPPAHLSYIERQIDKFFYNGKVSQDFNCYYYRSSDSEDPTKGKKVKITNFVIKIIHSLQGDDGTSRLIQLVSNYGCSRPRVLTPDLMVSKAAFQKFCLEQGDYTFSGTETALTDIWQYLFMYQTGQLVNKAEYFGYNKDHNLWIFGNGAYKNDKFYEIDDSNIVTIADEGFSVLDTSTSTEVIPPVLSDAEPNFKLSDIVSHLTNIVDGNNARQFVAWCLGNVFMPEILDTYGVYPFLFLYGIMGSGKSTLAEIAMSFFGNSDSKGMPFGASSLVGLSRSASRVSMLPVWIEEFRNNVDGKVSKLNYLRSIYDKSTIVKGTKKVNEIMTYKARSSVVISGEEYPTDAALVSRCMLLNVNKDKHNSPENKKSYQWIKKHKADFSYYIHSLLLNRDSWWPKVKAQIDEYLVSFKDVQKSSERNKLHHSIIAGVADTFLSANDIYSQWVLDACLDMEQKVETNQALNVFWDDLLTLTSEQKIKQTFYSIIKPLKEKGKTTIALNLQGVYGVWETTYQDMRRELPMSRNALADHITKEAYFLGRDCVRINESQKKVFLFDWDHERFPDALKQTILLLETKFGVSSPLHETNQEKLYGI